MKKIILLFIIFLSFCHAGFACEICGCGIGNGYLGILPEFKGNIFGFRYRYNAMRTHLGVGGAETYLTTAEHYHTVEAWGAVHLGRHFRVMGSVPFGVDARTNQGVSTAKSGMGDVSVSGFYQLINLRKTMFSRALLVQTLWIGGGVKFATGSYNPLDKGDGTETANLFQLGTGSTDFTLTAMYDLRLQDAGLNLTGSYKMNTANRYDYRYGNKLNGSAQLYYKIKAARQFSVAPGMGVQAETGERDKDHGVSVDLSGGRLLMGTVGAEMVFHNIAVGGNWQTPLGQRLANGIIRAGNRVMIHCSYIF